MHAFVFGFFLLTCNACEEALVAFVVDFAMLVVVVVVVTVVVVR